ncbi:hypothetical protein BS50DRAFT_591723 [Corynespora cassiicola Philippines]|uniref:Uncharacterized protein n=1 Tax=Corynespora cassiicola Philippines TaxID=1448308 RepID=A0A2T2NAL8_CORCC|nr:hypothetical protein BS50DRAFT_591723 [Corynespora cassiicola Philippines]
MYSYTLSVPCLLLLLGPLPSPSLLLAPWRTRSSDPKDGTRGQQAEPPAALPKPRALQVQAARDSPPCQVPGRPWPASCLAVAHRHVCSHRHHALASTSIDAYTRVLAAVRSVRSETPGPQRPRRVWLCLCVHPNKRHARLMAATDPIRPPHAHASGPRYVPRFQRQQAAYFSRRPAMPLEVAQPLDMTYSPSMVHDALQIPSSYPSYPSSALGSEPNIPPASLGSRPFT